MRERIYPAWIPCAACGNFYCSIHQMHAHDCPCPPIEDWREVDPYSDGGKPIPGYDYGNAKLDSKRSGEAAKEATQSRRRTRRRRN